jgi:hypothetical protein
MSHTLAIPLLLACGVATAEGPPTKEADAQTLKAAGIPADDRGLLAFLGGLRRPPGARTQVEDLVAQLGDANFTRREAATRELTKLAGFARPDLERAARRSDRETARRATAILAEYEAGAELREDTVLAVLREVARRKTAGAVPLMLTTPQLWGRSDFRKAAERALNSCVGSADLEALRQALNAPNLLLREAAAVCLLNQGDRRSLAVLGRLLDSKELEIRNRAGRVLRAVSRKDFGFVAYAAPAEREKAAAAWRRWVEREGRAARLTLPAPAESSLGKVLMCSREGNRLLELGEDGKKVWEMKYTRPVCCQGLANGHRVVGADSGRVDEYDPHGNLVWSLERLHPPVAALHRLANRHTVVAHGSNDKSRLQEFRPDRTVCWELPDVEWGVLAVQRLDNGNTLAAFVVGEGVVEWDRRGSQVWHYGPVQVATSVQRLVGGSTLITEGGWDRILEVDRNGKCVWSHTVKDPTHAQRLPNGHTVIATKEKVFEIDRAGKVLWECREAGVTHLSAY